MDLTPATSLVVLSSDIQHRGSLSDKSNLTCFIMPIPFFCNHPREMPGGKCVQSVRDICVPADQSSTITRLKQDLFFLRASDS